MAPQRTPNPPSRRRSIAAAALALALACPPAAARHPDLDLDALSDAQIDAMLQAELDDDDLAACGLTHPDASKTIEEMFEIVMCALGDEGDEGEENDLDEDDLEAEMEEANTTLEAEVRKALERADAIAFGLPARDAALHLVAAHVDPSTADPLHADDALLALKDGRINPGKAAVVPVKLAIRTAIRAAR